MYSLSIQNAIEYKIGKKPLKSEMLIVRFSVGVTELSVFQTLQCTQPLVRWVPETRNLGLKRLKREAHHTPASLFQDKSELSYSSTVPIRFFWGACTRTYFRPNLCSSLPAVAMSPANHFLLYAAAVSIPGNTPPPWRSSPPVGQDLFIVEASRSHSDTPHSVELLWTSDQPNRMIST